MTVLSDFHRSIIADLAQPLPPRQRAIFYQRVAARVAWSVVPGELYCVGVQEQRALLGANPTPEDAA